MTRATIDVPRCRSCGDAGLRTFLSLGKHPLPDALLRPEQLADPEPHFPLDVAFCGSCTLVQLLGEVPPEMLFVDNYLYFSSFSDRLLAHARDHALALIESRDLGPDSLVVEVASNDGYLLKNFVDARVPVLGIDPAPDQALAARRIGVPTIEEFFGVELAERLTDRGGRADVVIANNVMAHVPDLNGFVGAMAILLDDDGVITVENPYVRDLIEHGEFDTIYHEHFYYHSCTGVDALVRRHGLYLNDVEYFPDLHGGTLRWHIGKREDVSDTVRAYLDDERKRGMTGFGYYADFAERVETIKRELLELLEGLKADGNTIAAYGAAAKGSTLINYVGVDSELVDFVVDRNPHKHGRLMPGMHLPIFPTDALREHQPDYVLILAWNFAGEIVAQQQEYLRRGGHFIVPVPTPEVIA
ncbi:MAG: class I SAM-dependent methyltransferase [Actinobacteria bacterium]|nr:class I SAM-dependent methyltransferase [Actinomycetota bacterium]